MAKHKDKIKGGLADKKKPSDFNPKTLKQGTKVETEHTSDKSTAKEIAMDHLVEDKKYYKKLKEVEKGDMIEVTPDGKREPVEGKEPLKKKPNNIEKTLKNRWDELKKDLDSASAFMPMVDEDEDEEKKDPQAVEQEAPQEGTEESQPDENSNGGMDSKNNPEAENQANEDPQAAEQELAQALKDLGHSDAEIAHIVHGHMLPPPDLEAEKVKSEAMSGQTESQLALQEAEQNKQHKDMEMQTQLEHQKNMNKLAQDEASEKKGQHKIDQDHKIKMNNLEYEQTKKQKDLELDEAVSSKGSGKIELEHKKRMLDLEHKSAQQEKELELKFKEAEYKLKLKLMEESHKHKIKQAQEDAKVNSTVKSEQAKHKITEAKKKPSAEKSFKKSEDIDE